MSATRKDTTTGRRRGRSVPTIYGLVSLVLLALALTFALSSPPPTTPPLAAVAPAPQEQVEVERVEQSSRFGEGGGSQDGECVAGDEGCEGVGEQQAVPGGRGEQPEVVERSGGGDLRPCVNGPGGPRQTEDPQSPPCIAEIFTGDNGGATATGVTRDSVRIAVPVSQRMSDEDRRLLQAFAAHFNEHYELHGRSLVIDFVTIEGSMGDAEEARAFALEVASRDPFASLETNSLSKRYNVALAEQGVVSTVGEFGIGSPDLPPLRDLAPWVWSVYPEVATSLDAAGTLVCSALTGRPASHGGADVAESERVFGVLVEEDGPVRIDPTVLTSRLAACGAPFDTYVLDENANASESEPVFRRMRGDGVTSIICVCDSIETDITEAAERLDYHPEWILPATNDRQVNDGRRRGSNTHAEGQMPHMFGLTPHLRLVGVDGATGRERYEERYWLHAARDADPDITLSGESSSERSLYSHYAQLLLLSSGIQWAGPELTPGTFASALQGLTFANPGVGQAPWYQPQVGFGASDHTFNSDFALFWWDVGAVASTRQAKTGRMCYVGGGTRFTAATLPTDADDLLFDPEAGCR